MDMLSPRWSWEMGAAEERQLQTPAHPGAEEARSASQCTFWATVLVKFQVTFTDDQYGTLAGWQSDEGSPCFSFCRLGGVSEVDLQPRELQQVLVGAPCWGPIRMLCSQHRFSA